MASGRQHVNGVDLHYELTGRGKHAVLLLPGALGKYNNTPLVNGREGLSVSLSHILYVNILYACEDLFWPLLPQEALGLTLGLS